MRNGVLLITYPDSLGSDLSSLEKVLSKHFPKAITAVHVLPFYPSSADRGFAPKTYETVDPVFGNWEDLQKLGKHYDLVFDYMINHISRESEIFQTYLQEGPDSPLQSLFLDFDAFWGGSITEEQLDRIYKRKDKAPYEEIRFADGQVRKLWCTFGEQQIDLDTRSRRGLEFLEQNLQSLVRNGAKLIRLDAFAYATKRIDTDCFFVEPEIWELLGHCRALVEPYGADVLPEIHEHYSLQLKLARNGYPVYDFALPFLMLNALYFQQTTYLKGWLEICPRNQFTTLDTHDGIGVVDVFGLLPPEEIEKTKEHLYAYGANVKRIYNTEKYNNLDIYQINCTYYSALGNNDRSYLLARAVQFFCPGIPQVYYVGMLAGMNDLKLLEETKEGRNINRHSYSVGEIEEELARPVVQALRHLMELRSTHPAFGGTFVLEQEEDDHLLTISWEYETGKLFLHADFQNSTFTIKEGEKVLMRL